MPATIHFISGLPRSGSTLLSAILGQNPRMHAAMSSPVGQIVGACLAAMGAENEFASFLDEEQKRDILNGVFAGYYRGRGEGDVVFDTNRMWPARLPTLRKLFPAAKVICCVRNPAWVFDSVERLVRRNAFDVSRIFTSAAERQSVYSRADALLRRDRMIGSAWSALKEAYYGAEADMLLLVDYETLTARPADAMRLVYQFVGEPWFEHDFENVAYQAETFDRQLLAKDLHTVEGRVAFRPRQTILPPDLFRRLSTLTFWTDGRGTKAHRIVAASQAAPAPAGTEGHAG